VKKIENLGGTINQPGIRSPVTFTCRRGNLRTALMLSLVVAPSGQFNLPLLMYFSACWLSL